jgi:hypothetical protein
MDNNIIDLQALINKKASKEVDKEFEKMANDTQRHLHGTIFNGFSL